MTVTRNPLHGPCLNHPSVRLVAAEYQGLHVPLSTLRGRGAHDSGPVWAANPSPYDSCARSTSAV